VIVPDQSHINRVREALWERGCAASVMVGAGFSRNATRAGPHSRPFPLWQEMAKNLCSRLYPEGDGDRLTEALAEAQGTSGFLRLAQEYEVAFGRVALNRLIQELVPDEDYEPGEMHARLLRLPWRDVFTTNWDTLLERTRSLVPERAYSVVRIPDEIPSTARPRILKLHGSFPAHPPYIFTEEQYRTFPRQFAPVVNTVQQAMMETVFLLVGFSGDDPNFLHWSGWVRDNLGVSAPKIYLAGWLNLSPHRRNMLECRNVVPIDLAQHPKAGSWPPNLRHQHATDWILRTLELGEPYDTTEWPETFARKNLLVPGHLAPVDSVTIHSPVSEPHMPYGEATKATLEQLADLSQAWRHNRNVHPGWLVLPPSKQFLLETWTRPWIPAILHKAPELRLVDRLFLVRELISRIETMLDLLPNDVQSLAADVLSQIDCSSQTICQVEDKGASWIDVREAWREVALSLLTASRLKFDKESFDKYLLMLAPFEADDVSVVQRMRHEKCLLALADLDYGALELQLNDWDVNGVDPLWAGRKAALFAEIGLEYKAKPLVNDALKRLREASSNDLGLKIPSQESWILWMASALYEQDPDLPRRSLRNSSPFKRWLQLAPLQCNAAEQLRAYGDAIRGKLERKSGPLFEPWSRRGKVIRFTSEFNDRVVAAYKAIRLTEIAGLPPKAGYYGIASDLLRLAAEEIGAEDFQTTSRLSLRIAESENDATFCRIWARARIAALSESEIGYWKSVLLAAIEFALSKAKEGQKRSNFWVSNLRMLVEALSRVALRLPAEDAEGVFRRALQFCHTDLFAKEIWLCPVASHLLQRSWEALPKEARENLVLDVMSAPISGLDGFSQAEQGMIDPAELFFPRDGIAIAARNVSTEAKWKTIVERTIRGLQSEEFYTRQRAFYRLYWLSKWERLTSEEYTVVADALWRRADVRRESLPSGSEFHDFVFLNLPEVSEGQAQAGFRAKWINDEPSAGGPPLQQIFSQVGAALASRGEKVTLALSAQDSAILEKRVSQWIDVPVAERDPFDLSSPELSIHGLEDLLLHIRLPAEKTSALFEKVIGLSKRNLPVFQLYGGLARLDLSRLPELTMSMKTGLASDNWEVADNALHGLHDWIYAHVDAKEDVPAPPVDLVCEIGAIVATRRKKILGRALQAAELVFRDGNEGQRLAIAPHILHGLAFLTEELRYDRKHDDDDAEDIPLFRWACAHLALAMSEAGYAAVDTVAKWVEVIATDPLPEVRRAQHESNARRL